MLPFGTATMAPSWLEKCDIISLLVVHFNVVVYAMAYWLQTPVFPYLSKELGASAVVIYYLIFHHTDFFKNVSKDIITLNEA